MIVTVGSGGSFGDTGEITLSSLGSLEKWREWMSSQFTAAKVYGTADDSTHTRRMEWTRAGPTTILARRNDYHMTIMSGWRELELNPRPD